MAILLAMPALAQRVDQAVAQDDDYADNTAPPPGDNTGGGAATGTAAGQPSGPEVNPAPPPPAFADTVLPTMGVDPANGNLRAQLLDAFGEATPTAAAGDRIAPNWEIIPVLTVGEEWTDNAGLAAGAGENIRGGSDFITLIEPEVTLLGNTERLQVALHYDPVGEIFAENSAYSQWNENADGDILATLLPGWLYFDLRGNISQVPVFGGLGYFNNLIVSPNDRETVSSAAATPYVAHTFGGTGTLQAGVGYLYSATNTPGYLNQPGVTVPLVTAYNYGSSWLATERAFASFTTGENLGRFQNRVGFDGSWYDGSGELRDGRRVLVTDDASYAVNRFFTLLGEVGYENTDYPEGGFSYVGGVWAAGVRLTPSANSTITAEYRYIDGFGSPYIYGSWQITPRIRIFGGYSEAIETFDQDQQDQLLAGTTTGPAGVTGSTLMAAPLLYDAGLFSSNQALNRLRRLDASAVYLGNRDTITASFDWERSSIVGNPYGLPTSLLRLIGRDNPTLTDFGLLVGSTSTNYTGGVDWVHELTATLTSTLYAGYTHSHNAEVVFDDASAVLVSAGLTKVFTDTLSGAVTYAGTYFVSGTTFGDLNRNNNTVTVSVTKRF
ncbi:MAG TPA: hypothetical protein VMB71_02575 [Acetobacteraceae bacterium]|nr:hypothetical protein [Acetobacteraceae bacterium]